MTKRKRYTKKRTKRVRLDCNVNEIRYVAPECMGHEAVI